MKQSVQAKENPEKDKSVTGYNQGKQKREKIHVFLDLHSESQKIKRTLFSLNSSCTICSPIVNRNENQFSNCNT